MTKAFWGRNECKAGDCAFKTFWPRNKGQKCEMLGIQDWHGRLAIEWTSRVEST